ncbi:MAG: elongation factor G [Hyphomicrobiaceae bacterium]
MGQQGVGKSTLVDHLAALEKTAAPPGQGNDIRCVRFPFLGDNWAFLDCPGSVELLQKSMDALLVADAAVFVVQPNPDQAVLASPYLRLLERSGIPFFIFVNRIDETQVRLRDLVSALQTYASHTLMLRQVPIREGSKIVGAVDLVSERAWKYREEEPSDLIEIPADMIEREAEARSTLLDALADHDDTLLEQIIEDKVVAPSDIYGICARVLRDNVVTPILSGSASHGNGMMRLMKALRHEVPGPEVARARFSGSPTAVTFDCRHRKHVGKAIRLRAFDAGLSQGTSLAGAAIGSLVEPEGEKPGALDKLEPGDIGMALKSDHLVPGRACDADTASAAPDWYAPLTPLLSRVVRAKNDRDDVKLSESLAKLVEDDPALHYRHDAETGVQILETQGVQHLRQTRESLQDVFGVETVEDIPPTAFRETISKPIDQHYRHKKQSGGSGQYADIKIHVKPTERGEGISFEETIHGGSVPRNYIPAVENGVREACQHGPIGCPVVDIHVTLHDGQHHAVDSSDMAFRIAGRMGLHEAIKEVGSVLLEPFYEVKFHIPQMFSGTLSPLVSQRRGQILGYDQDETAPGWDTYRALLPGAALDDLIADLRAATQGVGRFEAKFDHYQEMYGREAETAIDTLSKNGRTEHHAAA